MNKLLVEVLERAEAVREVDMLLGNSTTAELREAAEYLRNMHKQRLYSALVASSARDVRA